MKNEDKIYVGGTFDLFHAGHVNLLYQASTIAPNVIVALNGDEFVKIYKGQYPILNERERQTVINSCKYVSTSFIVESHEAQPKHIESVKPNYILHGDDWTGNSLLKQLNIDQKFLNTHDIQLKYVPYTDGISSTDIKERIIKRHGSMDTIKDHDISHRGYHSPYK